MDPNKRRLLEALEAEAAAELPDDVELSTLSAAELLAYLRARRYAHPRADGLTVADPMEAALYKAYLAALPDDALIAVYEASTAEVAAAEAEQARRRPTPEPATLPVPVIDEPPLEPHPLALEKRTPITEPEPPPASPGAHVSVAVEGCTCLQCQVHRDLAREEARDRALAQMYEHAPMTGDVVVGDNATPELRRAVGGRQY